MQMATGSNSIITHWAYMCQATPGTTPPEPNGPPLNSGFLSNEWRWMEGTDWALTDTELFGSQPGSGVFQIESYRNGYFWGSGSGEGNQQFNVLGSVTPEGNLLFLILARRDSTGGPHGHADPDRAGERDHVAAMV